jgi:hypothetical protein
MVIGFIVYHEDTLFSGFGQTRRLTAGASSIKFETYYIKKQTYCNQ